MLRRFTSALVVAASVFVAVGIASPAHASDAGSFLQQINADRARADRRALTHRSDLAAVALKHSQRMAAKNSLYHNPSLTSQVTNWRSVGENVGMGGNTRVLHAAFMNSPAHRANILDADYTEIGLGVTVDSRGVMWVTEIFRKPMAAAPSVRRVAPTASATAKAPAANAPAANAPAAKAPATRAPAARARASARRPTATPLTDRPTARPAAKSAWLTRMSSAAAAPATRTAGALPRAVDYLRVVAG